jgi:hypothetical protein
MPAPGSLRQHSSLLLSLSSERDVLLTFRFWCTSADKYLTRTKMLYSTTTIIPALLHCFRRFSIEFRQTAAQNLSHVRFARVAVRWLRIGYLVATTTSGTGNSRLRLRIIIFEQFLISHRHPENYFQFLSDIFCFFFKLLKMIYFGFLFSPEIFPVFSLFLTELPNNIKIFSLGQWELFLV